MNPAFSQLIIFTITSSSTSESTNFLLGVKEVHFQCFEMNCEFRFGLKVGNEFDGADGRQRITTSNTTIF